MRKLLGLAVTVVVLGVAASAPALGPMAGPMGAAMGGGPGGIYGDFKPVVGAWAEYLMTMKDEEPITMRLAVVAKEGESYWYEMVMAVKDQGNMVTKMLVSGNPQDPQNVTRMILKAGDQPAMEMPVMHAPPAEGEADVAKEPEGEFVEKGVESVTVPAGTFQADHMQYVHGESVADVWVAAGIGPYGIVKSTGDEMEMVLTSHGTDAKTLITETPQKFSMPGMMRPPQGTPPDTRSGE